MNLTLSWDLFVIVFFALVITYSFIIGKHESVKVIIATYIAVVAIQGVGNILAKVSNEPFPLLQILGISLDITLLSSTKLVLFVASIIILAARSGITVEYEREQGNIVTTLLTGVFGFATAGLLLSTLLTYIADTPLLSPDVMSSPFLSSLQVQSPLMRVMIEQQSLWFAGPALLLVLVGFFSGGSDS